KKTKQKNEGRSHTAPPFELTEFLHVERESSPLLLGGWSRRAELRYVGSGFRSGANGFQNYGDLIRVGARTADAVIWQGHNGSDEVFALIQIAHIHHYGDI